MRIYAMSIFQRESCAPYHYAHRCRFNGRRRDYYRHTANDGQVEPGRLLSQQQPSARGIAYIFLSRRDIGLHMQQRALVAASTT